MKLKEILNHKNLQLPLNWDNHKGDFISYLEKVKLCYLELVNSIDPNDIDANTKQTINFESKTIFENLIEIVKEYYLGRVYVSHKKFDSLMYDINFKYPGEPFVQNLIPSDFRYYFKIRLGDNKTFKRKDLFHIPFEKRHKVETQRFSIPGLPCIYLGGSIYICWEELNRPNFDLMHISRYSLNNDIKIIDLTFRPENDVVTDELKNYLKKWALVAFTNISVKNIDSSFKPEYIIPQILLEWVKEPDNKEIDGIKFISTKVKSVNNDYRNFFSNLAIPVKTSREKGFCANLIEKFYLTNPISWQVYDTMGKLPFSNTSSIGLGANPNRSVKFRANDNEDFSYNSSKFENLESDLIATNTWKIEK